MDKLLQITINLHDMLDKVLQADDDEKADDDVQKIEVDCHCDDVPEPEGV